MTFYEYVQCGIEVSDVLAMNAKLQQKKREVRKVLKSRGVLKREGDNKFDKYKYFSEAQYKLLFTELFSEYGLEMKFNEESYESFEGSEKQANGRMAKITFSLIDTDTGFAEDSTITAEGIDKGDKAGYKAYTGALKYWLADTFMVATGDDPETESPDMPKVIIKCADCGREIRATKNKNGEMWQTDSIAKYTERRFGRCLCVDCMKKADNEKKENKE